MPNCRAHVGFRTIIETRLSENAASFICGAARMFVGSQSSRKRTVTTGRFGSRADRQTRFDWGASLQMISRGCRPRRRLLLAGLF